MFTFISILIVLVCIFIVFIVLIQDPKSGGMGSAFGGGSAGNSIIGAQKAGDILEKSTWGSAIILFVLCIASVIFLPKVTNQQVEKTQTEQAAASAPVAAPQQPASPSAAPTTPAAPAQ
ncbi:MAG: preprotein translocase subunit SecG [Chitinophagales bacterium]|nr:preprotein translocase subunit SecG [Chitinophagales bacterium]